MEGWESSYDNTRSYMDEYEVMDNSNTEVLQTPTCSSASCNPEVNFKYTLLVHSVLCTEMHSFHYT